jgi:transcriptional regulator with XRE-family HTH domain
MPSQQTLGDYMRELRKKKEWSLVALSEETGLNYPHLSRIENNSAVPTPQTVVTLADALGGDLNLMLELADCLPKQILERLSARPDGPVLGRSAGGSGKPSAAPDSRAAALAKSLGVPESEVEDVAEAVVRLLRLDSRRRRAVVNLMKTFDGGGGGQR